MGMKIGLDIHGVIDTYPELFAKLSRDWTVAGHEVYIITGEPRETSVQTVVDAGMLYMENFKDFFSIVDWHIDHKTPSLRQDDQGHYWVDRNEWIGTKGLIATELGLDMHFDDCIEYFEYFPKTCCTIYVPPTNFDLVLDILHP